MRPRPAGNSAGRGRWPSESDRHSFSALISYAVTTLPRPAWHHRLVRWGRRKTQVLITAGSVLGSLVLVAGFFVWFGGTRADVAMYFIPAIIVPMIVAPLTSSRVLDLAFDLEAAHAVVATQAEELEALLLAAPIGLAEVAADGRVRRANAKAVALLGDTPLAAAWSARLTHDAERTVLLAAIRDGQPISEVRQSWRDTTGRDRCIETHVAPIGRAGAGADAMLVLHDITEREAAEAALMRARQLELVGRLAGGLAHDFNNLLTVIRANAVALREGDRSSALQAIDDAAESGARLTRRLLAISGHQVHAPERQPIAPIVEETLALAARLLPRGVRLERPGPVPDVTVDVDRDALQQALLNLLVNARDGVGGQGTVRLDVALREAEDRSWLVLSVHDDGAGMSPDVLARATEPFFTTKATHQGTGLGLPVVHDTMERHGGRLVLASTEGLGTTASLWVPAPEAIAPPVSRPGRSAPNGIAVLLVDDEPLVRHATATVLRTLGYTVTTAESAPEARAALSGESFGVVISDVMMPGETGLDLLAWMRTSGLMLPVLLVSGYSPAAVEAAVAADARAAFLSKPWSMSDLDARIRELLAASSGGIAGGSAMSHRHGGD